MAQIDQGEVGELQVIGDLEPESPLVEVQRFRFVEHSDHRVNRF